MKKQIFIVSLLLVLATLSAGWFSGSFWGMSRENISEDLSVIHKFGQNTDIDIAAEETVWSVGGDFVLFPDDSLLEVVCDSTADDTSGTGALTLQIWGIDSLFKKKTATVGLGGQDTVAIGDSMMMVYRMKVLTAGTGLTNAGKIKVQTVTGNTVMADIQLGYSQATMSVWPVPLGTTAYIHYLNASNSTNAADVTIFLKVKEFGAPWTVMGVWHSRAVGTSNPSRPYPIPLEVVEKSIIKINASTDTDNSNVTADFDIQIEGSTEQQ